MGHKDWSATAAQNRRLYPQYYKRIDESNTQYTALAGVRPVMLPKHIRDYTPPQYPTTNEQEAKKLGITARQVSKIRNGKKPHPKET